LRRVAAEERDGWKWERGENEKNSETGDNGNSAIVLAASMVCRNSGDNEGVTEVTNVTPVFIDFESLAASKEDA